MLRNNLKTQIPNSLGLGQSRKEIAEKDFLDSRKITDSEDFPYLGRAPIVC